MFGVVADDEPRQEKLSFVLSSKTSQQRNGMSSISAADREAALEAFADEFFHKHLLRTEGVFLPPFLRCAIAQSTVDSLTKCEGCKALPKSTCLRPGTKLFATVGKLNHREFPSITIAPSTTDKEDNDGNGQNVGYKQPSTDFIESSDLLTIIIRTLVNHQSRIDKQWYDDAIGALKNSKIVSGYDDSIKSTNPYLAECIFSEILILASIAHGIHSTYVLLSKALPTIPHVPASSDGVAVTPVRWDLLLKENVKPRLDHTIMWMPYILSWDINWNQTEHLYLDKEMQSRYNRLMLVSTLPQVTVSMAPVDLMESFVKFSDTYYINEMVRVVACMSRYPLIEKRK